MGAHPACRQPNDRTWTGSASTVPAPGATVRCAESTPPSLAEFKQDGKKMPKITKRSYATTKRKAIDEEDYLSRQIARVLCKLETSPGARYEEILDDEEMELARLLMRAAVNHVQGYIARQRRQRFKLPKCFNLYGRRYRMRHSNLGRVFITTKHGVDVLGSGFFEI